MSEENVEIIRRAIEAYGREGLDGTLRYYDPSIEWTSTGITSRQPPIAVTTACAATSARWKTSSRISGVEPVELIEAGEQVISSVRFTGRGKSSGAPVEMTLISVGSLREGLVYRVHNYPSMADALEAAGLRELP